MMFKAGDKVKFKNSIQEGSGVVVGIDYDGDYLVKSLDIKQGHSASLSDCKQDDEYNWWFRGTDLSIDTQEVHTLYKVGDKVRVSKDCNVTQGWLIDNSGGIFDFGIVADEKYKNKTVVDIYNATESIPYSLVDMKDIV